MAAGVLLGMVVDRFTNDHSYVFLFTKSKKYYFEQQFEAQSENRETQARNKRYKGTDKTTTPKYEANPEALNQTAKAMFEGNKNNWYKTRTLPNGRNKRTVWAVDDEPVDVDKKK